MEIPLIAGLVPMFFWGVNALFETKSVMKAGVIRSLVYVHLFLIILGLIPAVIDGGLPDFNLKFFIFLFGFAFFDFIATALFYQGFKVSKVSIITPVASSYAILTAVISLIFFHEAISETKFGLIVMIIIGIILLSVNLKELKKAKRGDFIGVAYAIVIFTIYGIWVPLWDRFIAQGGYLFILVFDRVIILLLVLAFAAIKKYDLRPVKSANAWIFISAAFVVVASCVYNWGLYNSDQTSLIAAISSAYPLFSVLSAYLFLKEKLSLNQYIGIGVIITGIVLISVV